MSPVLFYFHDPMCSWCYAFQAVLTQIRRQLPEGISMKRVLGGLAADDDEIMPQSMQDAIRGHWRRIQELVPGTEFNFDFWETCQPRRSTYPACRAVIAAAMQGEEHEDAMIRAIQRAYYREARNPSDYQTHLELVEELQLDSERFKQDLLSTEVNEELIRQISFTLEIGVRSFPSLVLKCDDNFYPVQHSYTQADMVLSAVDSLTRQSDHFELKTSI